MYIRNKVTLSTFVYLIFFVLFFFMACRVDITDEDSAFINPPNEGPVSIPGLRIDNEGVLIHNGKPFHGVGVNYFNAFFRTISRIDNSYEAGFEYLKNQNIPFIRFMACGYWPSEWNLYLTNKQEYFSRMDRFVETAERIGIGLIPSLFWANEAVPDIVGEPMNQWGNPNSQTMAFMRNYVQDVVTRYKDSPAIWAWEYGNEMNLLTDLSQNYRPPIRVDRGTPEFRTADDRLVTSDLVVALTEFSKAVRQYDSDRVIISGNSAPRHDAYHRSISASGQDSKDEYITMLDLQHPDGVNTLSVHIYAHQDGLYFKRTPASLKELIQISMDAAMELGKPLFIGEFGAESALGMEREYEVFKELLEGIEESRVPLAALWVYDYSPQDGEWNVTANNYRQYQLKEISELNERIR